MELKFQIVCLVLLFCTNKVSSQQGLTVASTLPPVFSPTVTATCRAGVMTVKVESLENFLGVVQSRDYRKPECSSYGENTRVTYLRINMLSQVTDSDYCGVFITDLKDEFSVAIAVRLHKTLELAGDKFYMITCGKAGFQNTRNETSIVNLELIRGDEKVQHVVYGQDYNLRAHISQPDGKFDMKVKRCFSFSNTNNTVKLVDDRGCPNPDILSEFKYNRLQGTAEAKLYSMFKFPESNRVHFQCDIIVCKGRCPDVDCNSSTSALAPRARSLQDPQADALSQSDNDGALMASYSVFVVEPGEQVDLDSVCQDCNAVNSLVYYLCLAFGILFLVMLIVNVYLCCAMTSSGGLMLCNKKQKEVAKEKSISSKPEEFDPYARSWHGSQYGSRFHLNSMSSKMSSHHPYNNNNSGTLNTNNGYGLTNSATLRYSLNGQVKPMPVPYLPADTKIGSISNPNSDDYINSRPDSRYSHQSRPVSGPSRTRSRSRNRSRSKHRQVQSSSSGQSGSTQYSRAESTGRLVANGARI